MKLLLQWFLALALSAICFVPAYLGLQFTNYAAYLLLTVVCAVATLVVMGLVHKVMPLWTVRSDIEKDHQ